MAICFPLTHGRPRCTQGRPYSQQSPPCSSFTGSQSPVCWIRQQSSKICVGHRALELSRLIFGFLIVTAPCIYHPHPTFLSHSCSIVLGGNTLRCPFLCELGRCSALNLRCDLNPSGPQFPYQQNEGFGERES